MTCVYTGVLSPVLRVCEGVFNSECYQSFNGSQRANMNVLSNVR